MRSFVFDSYRVYCDLLDGLAAPGHRSSNSETDRADRAADQFQKSSFAEISQRFRAVLAELNQSINAAAEALDQGQHKCARDADNLDEEYDMVCMVENLWRIAEVFCLNQSVVLSIEMAKLLKVSPRLLAHFTTTVAYDYFLTVTIVNSDVTPLSLFY